MKVSPQGLIELAHHEGVVPAPYLDSRNVWTFGIGHTAAAGPPDPALMARGMPEDVEQAVAEALTLFRVDVAKYEDRVRAAIHVPLEPHQFDALVSFDYNTGGIFRAKLTRAINRGDFSGDGFMGWLRPPEIRDRRKAELELFEFGRYSSVGKRLIVWKVSSAGKLIGRHSTINVADIFEAQAPALTFTPEHRSEGWWQRVLAKLGL